MLVAPVTMAAVHGQQWKTEPAAAHCQPSSDHETGKQLPAMELACKGACSAMQLDAPELPERVALRLATDPHPLASPLSGVLLDHDTPPPRLS
nr:hypothetical protein [Sphingomonas sp. Y57]